VCSAAASRYGCQRTRVAMVVYLLLSMGRDLMMRAG
jgi:hypothetical protein